MTLAYPARKDVPVLRGLTLAAAAGERIARVEPSGAGKSTVVANPAPLLRPGRRGLLIDGRDARDYPLAWLRGTPPLSTRTCSCSAHDRGENRLRQAGAGDTAVEAAARQANALDFIAGFPDGYQTVVGERGVKLSGGQRQRVAIARAILRDPAVLILDEATSSLDSESEQLVQQALDGLMRGRTSVIIAHRLSTVRRADRIFVIDRGRVAETGTHVELLAREGGKYRTLVEPRFAGP